MDRESAELNISVFPLRALVEESAETLKTKIEAKRIRFASAFEDPEIVVHADREKVLQVFLNLLSNAVKFNRDGGEIRVDARAGKQGLVSVQVQDTGIGVPEGDLDRIFDRFYRAGAGAGAPPEGTGLGLSIVRSLLRLHGCSIRAESQVGRGTTFTFTLPVASAEGEDDGGSGAALSELASFEPPAPSEPPPASRPPNDGAPPARPRFRIIRRG
jgi:two-component system sensor histidine kinase VicK